MSFKILKPGRPECEATLAISRPTIRHEVKGGGGGLELPLISSYGSIDPKQPFVAETAGSPLRVYMYVCSYGLVDFIFILIVTPLTEKHNLVGLSPPQIPEFDNFYLDMNGIIHVCAHPNDDDPTFRISEEKIFSDIFNYLEVTPPSTWPFIQACYFTDSEPCSTFWTFLNHQSIIFYRVHLIGFCKKLYWPISTCTY